ncbi:isochorismatase family protein [Lactiplantibacillus mudanjiangensis]|uniref:Isochorismatase-like domain-containing protein n=1 Tax=Lactiplantibacillus mudanjiangensis TaxID=1296538 RepID=A0A660E5R3_9LACO|nr:isochorismatase family protein [Lactiplantibacillus mudanjiangensis]VDG17710.1 hypothetical protein [Lactobacillus paracollinoides] [Lactiplantibacillus mudanjiangensis]VDG24932.1 hypothetical protein [Lactobacillus paracollinoides] [Lactiplantibacillus mudanjiangensis]VDG29485.1 hypothetical protein [Lactobacillus paracollinoides] [Lactiplantibacillus mudanjiangensis]
MIDECLSYQQLLLKPSFQPLRQNQIQRLAATGFTLDNGIRKTVADATKIGIETVILKDAVVARNSTTFQTVLPQFDQVSRMADFLATD